MTLIQQIANEIGYGIKADEFKVKKIIDNFIYFTDGTQNFSAQLTKTGKLKKHSMRIDTY